MYSFLHKAFENISVLTGMSEKLYTDVDIIRKIWWPSKMFLYIFRSELLNSFLSLIQLKLKFWINFLDGTEMILKIIDNKHDTNTDQSEQMAFKDQGWLC